MKKLIALCVLFTFATVMSYAIQVNSTGKAKAKIIQAATISHDNAGLDFGTIIPGTTAGTVVLDHVATPEAADTNLGGRVTTDGVASDHFTLSNLDADTTYTIGIPEQVTITSGGESMTVDLDPSASSVHGETSLVLYVGGTLHVGANQVAGSYTGDYPVAITY